MMAQLESPPKEHGDCAQRGGSLLPRNLVLVASEPPSGHNAVRPIRSQPTVAGPKGLRCTRIAAHTLAASTAWCRRRAHQIRVSPQFEDPIGGATGRLSDLP
jgi:hypothetical protein